MSELERMQNALDARARSGLLRALRVPDPSAVDFSSNDYLGISHRQLLSVEQSKHPAPTLRSGATGSRLLSGHSSAIEELERNVATFHRAPAALLFNSGYDANLGFFSSIPQLGDVVVYDELIHASVHDGMRLGRSRENLVSFPHNSVPGLRRTIEAVLRRVADGDGEHRRSHTRFTIFIAVESIYSMDGDVAPLTDFLSLADEFSTVNCSIALVVDEAHGVGIAGPNGAGVAVEQSVHNHHRLLARIVTYGKAFGAHGACVLGSSVLRQYLVNYARPLIYSTSLPPHSVAILARAYEYMLTRDASRARETLNMRRDLFRQAAKAQLPSGVLLETGSQSPIQGILVPGNNECVAVASMLCKLGFDAYPIRSPTVPKGSERIRIIIHAHNEEKDIRALVFALAKSIREVARVGRHRSATL